MSRSDHELGMFRDISRRDFIHGVGLAAHESPRLAPRKTETLKEGMVVTVEPGIYIPQKGGVRLEDMVAIGKKGIKILTQCNYLYDF